MDYQTSEHFDGKTFFNPDALRKNTKEDQGFRRRETILQWQFGFRPRWPDTLPEHEFALPPSPKNRTITTTFINHASFLLRFGRENHPPLNVLTDPILSKRCSPFRRFGPARVRKPGLAFDDTPRIDVILVSHCHYDHLDLPTLRAFARRDDPLCITPLGNGRHLRKAGLRRIVEMDWWETTQTEDFTITCTPAIHGSARTPFDTNRALWSGFLIESDADQRVLFAGDSAHGLHWDMIRKRLGAPDLALLPIGAYEPRDILRRVHMNPEEALEAFHALHACHALGMHFGTFQLTDEAIGEPPARLRLATRAQNMPDDRFETLENGESRIFTFDRTVSRRPR